MPATLRGPVEPTPDLRLRVCRSAIRAEMSEFLIEADVASSGFVFRHGWLIELILRMLEPDPARRMTVKEASAIATSMSAVASGLAVAVPTSCSHGSHWYC